MTGLKIGVGEKTYLYETEVNNKKNAKPELISGLDANLIGNGVVELSWSKPPHLLSLVILPQFAGLKQPMLLLLLPYLQNL